MVKKNIPVRVGDERVVYQGRIIEVVEQDMQIGGREITFERARRSPGTRLIIVREGRVLLTREYRTELEDYDYRLPGGKVFDSLTSYNEFLESRKPILNQAMIAAKKEAKEEIGLKVKNMSHYHTSKCGATVEWDLFYFVINDFSETKDGQKLEHGENIEPKWVRFKEAREICVQGKMQEDRSVGVLLRYLDSI